jgi:hypothetical protein
MTYKEIPYVWLKNAKTDEEKQRIVDLVTNNRAFIKLLLEVLQDYAQEIDRKGMREDDYKEAGILALLAFRNGQMSMLDKVAGLFNFKTKEG